MGEPEATWSKLLIFADERFSSEMGMLQQLAAAYPST